MQAHKIPWVIKPTGFFIVAKFYGGIMPMLFSKKSSEGD